MSIEWELVWEPDHEILENVIESEEGLVEQTPFWNLLVGSPDASYQLDLLTDGAWMSFTLRLTEDQADMLETALYFAVPEVAHPQGQIRVYRDGKLSRFLYPNAQD